MRGLSLFLMAAALTAAVPSYGEEPRKEAQSQAKTAYEYSSQGRRDPFVPLIVTKEAKPKPRKGILPQESYEVAELKLIAILSGSRGSSAVVTLPDGKSYTIREGDSIGPYGGRVSRITPDSVVIRESSRDYRGVLRERDMTLKLRKEEE